MFQKNKLRHMPVAVLLLLTCGVLDAGAQQSMLQRIENASERQLQALLPKFPAADADGDGTLTRAEAIAFVKKRSGGAGGQAAGNNDTNAISPTHANVAYGAHERNVLDFWQAAGDAPRPLVVFIHGGGFTSGDKSKWHRDEQLQRLLKDGISCAAINYRFRKHAPIQDILHDAARAVQFLRSKADPWNLDKTRFAAWGGSAGAGTSLWLGCRDDLADPDNADPVLRESTRVQAVVLNSTQATYNMTRWDSFLGPANPAWLKSPHEMAEFYHLETLADLATPDAAKILRECDMLDWIDQGDAPVFISNALPDTPAKNRGHYLHHPAHAREIQKACVASDVPCIWLQGPQNSEVRDGVPFVKQVFGMH